MESNNQADPNVGAPPVGAGSDRGIGSIIMGVFTGPTAAFTAFAKKPGVIVPLIVLIVVVAGVGALMAPYNASMQYDLMKTSDTLPPSVLEQMRQDSESPSYIGSTVGAAVAVSIITLLEALVVLFLGNVVYGGRGKFKAVWGVAMLAALIMQLGNLAKLPLAMAKGNMYVSYGLAAAMPGKDFTSMFYSICYYLDAFGIWAIIVSGIGYGIVFGLSKGKGITIAAIVGVLFTVVMIGLQLIGLSFAGVEWSFF